MMQTDCHVGCFGDAGDCINCAPAQSQQPCTRFCSTPKGCTARIEPLHSLPSSCWPIPSKMPCTREGSGAPALPGMLLDRHTPPAGQAQGQLEAHHHVCHPGRISLCRGLPWRSDCLCTGGCPARSLWYVSRRLSSLCSRFTELPLSAHCLLPPLPAAGMNRQCSTQLQPACHNSAKLCAHLRLAAPCIALASMPAWRAVRFRPAPWANLRAITCACPTCAGQAAPCADSVHSRSPGQLPGRCTDHCAAAAR